MQLERDSLEHDVKILDEEILRERGSPIHSPDTISISDVSDVSRGGTPVQDEGQKVPSSSQVLKSIYKIG